LVLAAPITATLLTVPFCIVQSATWPVLLSAGRVGSLICWESYMMPLARYALYAQDIDIYVAPTWDTGEAWLATLRHIAGEAGLAEAPAYACANQFTGTATKKRCSTFKVRVLHEGRFEAGRPQANAGGRRRGERENWGGLRFHSIK
jgi:predicted amidohydrolase